MPSMTASFGLASVPFAQMTNWAVISSPRSVPMRHTSASPSHMVEVTVVWNIARSYSSYLRAIIRQYS